MGGAKRYPSMRPHARLMGIAALHPSYKSPERQRDPAPWRKSPPKTPLRSCLPINRRPWLSPPFHVKRKRGWIATSISWWSGRPRQILWRPRPSRISGRGTSPIRCSSWTCSRSAKIWVDFGSGGGFPGVVLACALAETPDANVHLVERNAKKAAFLREAVRVTSAAATVHLAGIGDSVDRIGSRVDCVTARALAPLHQLVGFAEPFVKEGAKALFLKGQDVEAELTEATKYWNIEPRLHSSRTGGHGWIVELDRIERRNPSAITDGDRA